MTAQRFAIGIGGTAGLSTAGLTRHMASESQAFALCLVAAIVAYWVVIVIADLHRASRARHRTTTPAPSPPTVPANDGASVTHSMGITCVPPDHPERMLLEVKSWE